MSVSKYKRDEPTDEKVHQIHDTETDAVLDVPHSEWLNLSKYPRDRFIRLSPHYD